MINIKLGVLNIRAAKIFDALIEIIIKPPARSYRMMRVVRMWTVIRLTRETENVLMHAQKMKQINRSFSFPIVEK